MLGNWYLYCVYEIAGKGVIFIRVLDLDLDFFLDEIAHWITGNKRLDGIDFVPWTEAQVRVFLENSCGLSINTPCNGRVVTHHDEAFYFWRELIEKGLLKIPFEIVHIDAHSDTGLGDLGWSYIMGTLLHQEPKDRYYPDYLGPGNYLAYALACRWVYNLKFILHPKWSDDLLWNHLKDYTREIGYFQLKKYNPNDLDPDKLRNTVPLSLEPEVPYETIPYAKYVEQNMFDYVVLSHSPNYTPETADKLIQVIKEYLVEV